MEYNLTRFNHQKLELTAVSMFSVLKTGRIQTWLHICTCDIGVYIYMYILFFKTFYIGRNVGALRLRAHSRGLRFVGTLDF